MIATAPFGTRVRVRSARAEDLDGLAAFYARLSPESRFARFHGVSRGIGDEASRLLGGPDHEHREGLVAEPSHPESTDGRVVGHICLEPAGPAIEMAVAVADEWQGRGIGQALLLAAVDWARARRIGLGTLDEQRGAWAHRLDRPSGPRVLAVGRRGRRDHRCRRAVSVGGLNPSFRRHTLSTPSRTRRW